MNISPDALRPATTGAATPRFWERLWRTAGIQSLALFVVAYLLCGYPPSVGASDELLAAFYQSGSSRILIATVCGGLAVLNLMWFAAALRSTLVDSGQGGWGAAATGAGAALGALVLLLFTILAALAFAKAYAGDPTILRGVTEIAWAGFVVSSFPRAMLSMAAAFGLWRAHLISNAMFAIGVAVVVLTLLGGTTWAHGGYWAPDGVFSCLIIPAVGAPWLLFVSGVLLTRAPSTRAAW